MTREQFCVTLSLSDLDSASWPTCPCSISWTAGESPDRSISQVVPSQSCWSSVTYSQGRVTSSPSLTTRTRTGCSVSAAGNRIRNTDSQCADRFHRDRPWVTTAEVKNTGTNRRRIKSKSETEVKCKLTCEVKLQSHYERHFNPHIFEHHVSVFSLLYFPSFSYFAIKTHIMVTFETLNQKWPASCDQWCTTSSLWAFAFPSLCQTYGLMTDPRAPRPRT